MFLGERGNLPHGERTNNFYPFSAGLLVVRVATHQYRCRSSRKCGERGFLPHEHQLGFHLLVELHQLLVLLDHLRILVGLVGHGRRRRSSHRLRRLRIDLPAGMHGRTRVTWCEYPLRAALRHQQAKQHERVKACTTIASSSQIACKFVLRRHGDQFLGRANG